MSTYDVLIRPKPYDKRNPYYATWTTPTTSYPDRIIEGNSSEYLRMKAMGEESVTPTNYNIGSRIGNAKTPGSVIAEQGDNQPYIEVTINSVKISIKPGATVTVPTMFAGALRDLGLL